jgi:hypothetical protein
LISDSDYNRRYVEWLEYILASFLLPWRYSLSGEVRWYGDDPLDRGTITVFVGRVEAVPDELAPIEHLEVVSRQIDEFRELLAEDTSEEELHQFLKDSGPLLGLTSTIDPISKVPLGSDYVTDFIVREVPDGYVLVEIERPGLRLFNKPKKVGYPPERSRDFNHALEQTEMWRDWVGRYHSYITDQFPGISPTPLCWLIAGRNTTLSTEEREQLVRYNEKHRHSIRVWTYDDFLERIETVLRRMIGR